MIAPKQIIGNHRITSPPEEPVISLSEAKEHLRVTWNEEDDYIVALVQAATDVAINFMSRQIIRVTAEVRFESWPNEVVKLPLGLISEITSVEYKDSRGLSKSLDSEGYKTILSVTPAVIRFTNRPALDPDDPLPITITVKAGYEDADAVPAPIKHAILLILGHLFENRQDVTTARNPVEVPMASKTLLTPYRTMIL